MENVTDIRLLLHQRGYPIIPVSGKRPPMEGWPSIRTNPAEIKLWSKVYPSARNTGLLTKYFPTFDVDILDPDTAEAVEALIRSRFEDCGVLSPRIGLSPKRAFVFRTAVPFKKLTLEFIPPSGKATGEKIEVLGDGEQVVVHGIHRDTQKPYTWPTGAPWCDFEPADVPELHREIAIELLEDIAELVAAEHGYTITSKSWASTGNGAAGVASAAGPASLGDLCSTILNGTDLHKPIMRLAMSFVGSGWSRAKAIAQLRSLMNNSRAKQDRPKDWQERYDDIPRAVDSAQEKLQITRELDELRAQQDAADDQLVTAAQKQPEEPDKPAEPSHIWRSKHHDYPCTPTGKEDCAADGRIFVEVRAPDGSQTFVLKDELVAKAPEPEPQPQPPPPSGPIAHWHGEADPLDTRPPLIENLLPEIGIGLISGQWGTYKTFNALELAHCVMTGRSYLGLSVVRPGGVLLLAPEGANEIPTRLQGVLDNKGAVHFPKAPFAWFDSCPPLTDPKTANKLIAEAKLIAERMRTQFNLPLSLILIDTIIGGAGFKREGQENDAAVSQAMMQTMAKVAQALGCFVLGLDHYGKDTNVGTRGSSAKEAAADVILACLGGRSEAGAISNPRLVIRKRRGGAAGEEFPFRIRVVDLGTNARGKMEKTLVIEFSTDPNAVPKTKEEDWGRAKPGRHLRKVIMSLMADHGQDIQPFPDGPTVRALKVEMVEAEFRRSYPAKAGTNKQAHNTTIKAFKRALEDAAIIKGVITTREIHGVDWVWLSRHTDEAEAASGPTENA